MGLPTSAPSPTREQESAHVKNSLPSLPACRSFADSQAPAKLSHRSAGLALLSILPSDFSWRLSGWQAFSMLLSCSEPVPTPPRCLQGDYQGRGGHWVREWALSHLENERMERFLPTEEIARTLTFHKCRPSHLPPFHPLALAEECGKCTISCLNKVLVLGCKCCHEMGTCVPAHNQGPSTS